MIGLPNIGGTARTRRRCCIQTKSFAQRKGSYFARNAFWFRSARSALAAAPDHRPSAAILRCRLCRTGIARAVKQHQRHQPRRAARQAGDGGSAETSQDQLVAERNDEVRAGRERLKLCAADVMAAGDVDRDRQPTRLISAPCAKSFEIREIRQRQHALTVRACALELAEQPVAALDRGIQGSLRRLLAHKCLLQLVLDHIADQHE